MESPRHGGESVAAVLRAHGVKYIFTLVGGHISPILVACEKVGIRIVDTRHEATAVFAADAVARLSGAFLRNILNTTVFKHVYTLMFEELIMGSERINFAVLHSTGSVGVAAVTAGPGLTNTVTAVKNAQMAESPLLLMGGAAGTLLQVESTTIAIQLCS